MLDIKKAALLLALTLSGQTAFANQTETLFDTERTRHIPLTITAADSECTVKKKCPVAFIGAGYGMAHTEYQFAQQAFHQHGYLTVEVAHELKGDPNLNPEPPYMTTRMENWHRGVQTLEFLAVELAKRYPAYDFNQLTLFGHSNGGDIAALYAAIYPAKVAKLITLDHRRMLIPRNKNIAVLTLRGSDYPADDNVLLTPQELAVYPVTQIKLKDSRHNDMYDGGPKALVARMSKELNAFLSRF
ncbi:alpha/beta hydrolase [Pseudoalteromonas sp.]|uniref:alpha/beta hydrolase n=1 Tax=Pseudoalteromonas sp. TaxID=53249 RepID=UPI003D119AC5